MQSNSPSSTRFPNGVAEWNKPLWGARTHLEECVIKHSTGASTLGGVKGSAGWDPDFGIGQCWLAVGFSRLPLSYIQAYLDDSAGVGACNSGQVSQILQFAKALRKFVVVGADFNVTP